MAQDMGNFILLEGYRQDRRAIYEQRKLDAKASYTVMEQCLKTIEINSMPELRNLKNMIRKTMKNMRDIENGK